MSFHHYTVLYTTSVPTLILLLSFDIHSPFGPLFDSTFTSTSTQNYRFIPNLPTCPSNSIPLFLLLPYRFFFRQNRTNLYIHWRNLVSGLKVFINNSSITHEHYTDLPVNPSLYSFWASLTPPYPLNWTSYVY